MTEETGFLPISRWELNRLVLAGCAGAVFITDGLAALFFVGLLAVDVYILEGERND